METIIGLMVGIGLAAACGFRVFVPLLGISIAARSGHLTLSPDFLWMASDVALAAFALATVLEIATYYIPWFDNLMDSLATPAAVVAGAIVTAAMVGDMSPFLKWSLAIIAGGGVAGVIKAGATTVRAASSVTTAGFGNPIVATGELAGSALTAGLAITMPVVTVALVALLLFSIARWFMRRTRPVHATPPALPTT